MSLGVFPDTGGFATVARTGDYDDLTGKPTLGTAASTDATAYATAAQGSTADTAIQPDDPLTDLSSGAATSGHVPKADGSGGITWAAESGGGSGGLPNIPGDYSGLKYLCNQLMGLSATAAAPGANTIEFGDLSLEMSDPTIVGIAIEVTTAAAGALAYLGLYTVDSSGNMVLIVDAGTVDCSTVGLKIASISSTTLAGNVFYGAVLTNNATVQFRYYSGGPTGSWRPGAVGAPVTARRGTQAFGALPSSYASSSMSGSRSSTKPNFILVTA